MISINSTNQSAYGANPSGGFQRQGTGGQPTGVMPLANGDPGNTMAVPPPTPAPMAPAPAPAPGSQFQNPIAQHIASQVGYSGPPTADGVQQFLQGRPGVAAALAARFPNGFPNANGPAAHAYGFMRGGPNYGDLRSRIFGAYQPPAPPTPQPPTPGGPIMQPL